MGDRARACQAQQYAVVAASENVLISIFKRKIFSPHKVYEVAVIGNIFDMYYFSGICFTLTSNIQGPLQKFLLLLHYHLTLIMHFESPSQL